MQQGTWKAMTRASYPICVGLVGKDRCRDGLREDWVHLREEPARGRSTPLCNQPKAKKQQQFAIAPSTSDGLLVLMSRRAHHAPNFVTILSNSNNGQTSVFSFSDNTAVASTALKLHYVTMWYIFHTNHRNSAHVKQLQAIPLSRFHLRPHSTLFASSFRLIPLRRHFHRTKYTQK